MNFINFFFFSGTIEAILTAKETFIEELQELSKSSSFQASLDKPKLQMITSVPSKKTSDESLKEALSLFRISPPGYDKKKNNYEIREFVSKCQSINKETDKREKTIKKLKEKVTESVKMKNSKIKVEEKLNNNVVVENVIESTTGTQDLQNIFNVTKNDDNDGNDDELKQIVNNEECNVTTNEEETDEKNSDDNNCKTSDNKMKKQTSESSKVVYKESDAKTISKIIQSTNTKIHFMWLSIKPAIHLKCFNYSPEIVNKFQKTSFCTKVK